jgi:phage tail sheath protein FI
MVTQVSYPGVYISEFAPGAPIQGVGTSTAAFIGPASSGELDEPTKVTSWDQFVATYGEQPLPGFQLWYAVRGFFENGGQVCYIVRASNGAYGELTLNDSATGAGNPVIRVRARQPGDPDPDIEIEVTATHRLPSDSTSLYQPAGQFTAISGRQITLAAGDAAQFRPGDWVTLGTQGERVQVVRVTGDNLLIGADLANAYAAPGDIRLADAPPGTRTIRIASTAAIPPGALVPGTMLTITQDTATDAQIVEAVQAEPLNTNPAITTYRVTFRAGLDIPLSLDAANAATVQSEEFSIAVTQGTASTLYDNLSIDAVHPRYFASVINGAGGLITVALVEPPPAVAPPLNLPRAVGPSALAGGATENLATLGDQDYIDALDTLREIDDVNLVAIPDRPTAAVQQAIVAHCEQMAERFGVLDPAPGLDLFGDGSIEEVRRGLDSSRGYGALYYPWLRVRPAGPGAPVLVPPSGHVCGIIARSDANRGVHKAPANEIVNGAVGVERRMSDIDQGQLNLQGINVIRLFQTGGRPVLWGARTTATDRNWQYVNVRRLFLFIEESIEEGIRWAVFEPNNLQLWQKLRRTITEFLTRVWRDGALFGATAEEAFYVRIDDVLNPFSEQALGRLNIEIGLRPTYPAEFIIVRIGIWQGGAEVAEG